MGDVYSARYKWSDSGRKFSSNWWFGCLAAFGKLLWVWRHGPCRDWANEPTKQTSQLIKGAGISRAGSGLMLRVTTNRPCYSLRPVWIQLYVIINGIILLDHIVSHPTIERRMVINLHCNREVLFCVLHQLVMWKKKMFAGDSLSFINIQYIEHVWQASFVYRFILNTRYSLEAVINVLTSLQLHSISRHHMVTIFW